MERTAVCRVGNIRSARVLLILAAFVFVSQGCVRNPDPVEPEVPVSPPVEARAPAPSPPPAPEAPPPPPPVIPDNEISSRTLEEINQDAPLEPIFFGYDSSDLNDGARAAIQSNLARLGENPTWMVTVEGHCDERGTPEYNLALGERRALAVRDHIVSLGLNADRISTVSYGKEFPFNAASNEEAWATNRRAHFVVTSQ